MKISTTSHDGTQASVRAIWVKPSVKRIEAGSAENGGRASSDGGIFQS